MMARRRRHDDLSPRSRKRNYQPLVLTLLVLGILGMLGYWYFNPQTAPSWIRSFVPQAPVRLYKWVDTQGKVRYSNTPPAAGVEYQRVDYWENANVIPAQPNSNN